MFPLKYFSPIRGSIQALGQGDVTLSHKEKDLAVSPFTRSMSELMPNQRARQSGIDGGSGPSLSSHSLLCDPGASNITFFLLSLHPCSVSPTILGATRWSAAAVIVNRHFVSLIATRSCR
jgi:hypothetical protein